jgi:hypothetical protein
LYGSAKIQVEALYRPSPETIQRSDNFPTSSTNNVAAAHLITSAISAGTHCIINPVSIHHSIELLFGRGNQSSDVLSLHASNLAPLWQVSVVKKWKLANTVCALGFRKLHATHMACHCGDESQVFQSFLCHVWRPDEGCDWMLGTHLSARLPT